MDKIPICNICGIFRHSENKCKYRCICNGNHVTEKHRCFVCNILGDHEFEDCPLKCTICNNFI